METYNTQSLDSIGRRFNTDKSSKCHGFLEFYDRELSRLRNSEIKLLEIGIFNGSSISTWREYFSKAEIYGVDINLTYIKNQKSKKLPNVYINYLDQSKREDVVIFFQKYGPFDIIVDDGSHVISHQKLTLEIGLEYLTSRGVYVLEDLHTSLPSQGQNYIDEPVTTLEVVENLKGWNVEILTNDTSGYKGCKSITSIITL